jgi:hypothetical protein
MKKAFSLLLVSILVISITGCGIKRKIQDKIGEAIGEKVIEGITDSKVNVEGDKVTIKGEDGTEFSMGSTEWPESDLLKDIPKFDKGSINNVTKSDAMVMIYIEGVEKKDYEDYSEEIKKNFTENTTSMVMDDIISYGGQNGKGVYVQLIYSTKEGTLNINSTKQEE